MHLLHYDEVVTVSLDTTSKCIVVEWNAYCAGALYRQQMEDVLMILKSHRSNRLLLNHSSKDMHYREDTHWLWAVWHSELRKVLGKNGKFAVVLSKYFNTINLTQGIQDRFFLSQKEALCWLSY